MSVVAVAALMRTEQGFLILEAIMGDSRALWWIEMQIAHSLQQSRRMIEIEAARTAQLRAMRPN